MLSNLPPLNTLKTFVYVGYSLSFKEAAENLRITQSAVSKQIKTLESFLNFPLFDRLPTHVKLTENGRAFHHLASEVLTSLEQGTLDLQNQIQPIQDIYLSAMPSFSGTWLTERLKAFQQESNQCRFSITMSESMEPQELKDIAVRMFKLEKTKIEGYRIDPMYEEVLIPVCHPRLIEADHPIRTPKDLFHYPLLGYTHRPNIWQRFFEIQGINDFYELSIINLQHFTITKEAVLKQSGVGLLPDILVSDLINQGELIRLIELEMKTDQGIYLLTKQQKQQDSTKYSAVNHLSQFLLSRI